DSAITDGAQPLPLTTAASAAPSDDAVAETSPDGPPSQELEVRQIDPADLDADSERQAVATKIGRRKPITEPEVLPPVGETVPVDELEKAAAEADRGFRKGIRPSGKPGGKRTRKPTPIAGAGAYSFVASEGESDGAGKPAVERADTAVPPRRRRYPQTSPGRRKSAAAGRGGEGGDRARRDTPTRRAMQFGERYLTNRSLDKLILDYLARRPR
ncbi:MAG: hypothetical protein JRI23_13150, partial [Deltaproteobacteria bacterium]|nr:hypothetical protein [Deltaproteobacteria bacterium]MBW2532670.1 hypothetical protein [Deltaproteobacteria bacterium]